jgi:hypothetical protein
MSHALTNLPVRHDPHTASNTGRQSEMFFGGVLPIQRVGFKVQLEVEGVEVRLFLCTSAVITLGIDYRLGDALFLNFSLRRD